MKITIEHTPITEAKRLVFQFHQAYSGFFIKNNMCVVPELPESKITDAPHAPYYVALPNIPLASFITDYSILNPDIDDERKHSAYTATVEKLADILVEKGYYREVEASVLKQIEATMPTLFHVEKIAKETLLFLNDSDFDVLITPTYFGTRGSWKQEEKQVGAVKKLESVKLSPRIDSLSRVDVLLGMSLSRSVLLDFEEITWRERQAVGDYVNKYIFGLESKFMAQVINIIDPKLSAQSILYQQSLGVPTDFLLRYDELENKIFHIERDISGDFAPYEFRLLRALIQNKNHTVSFDEIADDLYNSNADAKFSFWGITKTVQRVRDKLESMGVPREMILNVKGEGFKLVS